MHRVKTRREYPAHRYDRHDPCLRQAQAGDAQAFEQLVGVFTPEVQGPLLGRLRGDEDTASAAVQDAWLAAWQQLRTFRCAEHLVRWLHRVARFKAISMLRARRLERLVSWQQREGATSDQLREPQATLRSTLDAETVMDVREAVATLPDSYRGVATLYYLHGYPIQEISTVLCLPALAVKMRLHRARLGLRSSLRRYRPL